jgi:hypothetical protein
MIEALKGRDPGAVQASLTVLTDTAKVAPALTSSLKRRFS